MKGDGKLVKCLKQGIATMVYLSGESISEWEGKRFEEGLITL